MRTIIDTTITNLSQYLISKAAPPQRSISQATSVPTQTNSPTPLNHDYQPFQQIPNVNNDEQIKPTDTSYLPPGGSVPPRQIPIYPHQQQQYQTHQYPRSSYGGTPIQSQDSLATTAAAATAYMGAYSQPSYQRNFVSSASTPELYQAPGGPTSWRNFTGNMIPQWGTSPGEYMSSASALMQMGNGPRDSVAIPDVEQRQNSVYGEAPMWPMSLFEPNGSGNGI